MAMSKKEYFEKYKRDQFEFAKMQMVESDFPKPDFPPRSIPHNRRIEYESYNASIEEAYFWFLNYLKSDLGFARIDKITDLFSASEHSAFCSRKWRKSSHLRMTTR